MPAVAWSGVEANPTRNFDCLPLQAGWGSRLYGISELWVLGRCRLGCCRRPRPASGVAYGCPSTCMLVIPLRLRHRCHPVLSLFNDFCRAGCAPAVVLCPAVCDCHHVLGSIWPGAETFHAAALSPVCLPLLLLLVFTFSQENARFHHYRRSR